METSFKANSLKNNISESNFNFGLLKSRYYLNKIYKVILGWNF